MQGILLVDKPKEWTSFDAVNFIRRNVAAELGKKPKNVKVGHTGTLDPFATGLLVLLVGKEYTRQAQTLAKVDKTYEVTMRFGAESSTGDPEGEITEMETGEPSLEELQAALERFTGEISQIPPAYSAIKIDGQRAYNLARAGKEVKIEPRMVLIRKLELISYEYPYARLVAEVSSGTYIRTLVEDIAKELNSVAYATELRRTRVGDFSIEDVQIDIVAIKAGEAFDVGSALRA